jgi:hypothetical protein
MNWHLHVTVEPHPSWSYVDVVDALRRDVERHQIRPLVIRNHFRDNRPSYRELIPTKHHDGDEASASREIFHMGVLLNNAGWRVRRLKVEGNPGEGSNERRALYHECHVKVPIGTNTRLPISTTAKNTFATIRRHAIDDVYCEVTDLAHDVYAATQQPVKIEIEAIVLDTAPEMDEEWISQ